LVPGLAFGGHEEDFGVFGEASSVGGRGVEGFDFEEHAVATAVGGVIDLLPGAEAEVAEADEVVFDGVDFLGFSEHGGVEDAGKHVREQSDDGDFHEVIIAWGNEKAPITGLAYKGLLVATESLTLGLCLIPISRLRCGWVFYAEANVAKTNM